MGILPKQSALAQQLAALKPTELNAVAARDKTLAALTREKTAKAPVYSIVQRPQEWTFAPPQNDLRGHRRRKCVPQAGESRHKAQ